RWGDDIGLLASHGVLVKKTGLALLEATRQVQALKDGYARGSVPCRHGEQPADAIHHFLGAAVAELQALESLQAGLGTAETRAADVQKAVSVVARDKAVEAIENGMPFQSRSAEIAAKIDKTVKERDGFHPKTPDHAQLTQLLDTLQEKHK